MKRIFMIWIALAFALGIAGLSFAGEVKDTQGKDCGKCCVMKDLKDTSPTIDSKNY